MAVYAVGDIQGCFRELEKLLSKLSFDQSCDEIWFAGDLFNRGPDNLSVYRLARELGDAAKVVMGNHEIHLLAVASGVRKEKANDTISDLLTSDLRDEIVDWVQKLPLLVVDTDKGYALSHAGRHPEWSISEAKKISSRLEGVIQSDKLPNLLSHYYQQEIDCLAQDDSIANDALMLKAFNNVRWMTEKGKFIFKEKRGPDDVPHFMTECFPWYAVPNKKKWPVIHVVGHWSSHGYYWNQKEKVLGLDTGCVWGNSLTAVELCVPQVKPIQVKVNID
jgi:bis(5'-nucleosyl)-tetraphosphatase (symmetrical)